MKAYVWRVGSKWWASALLDTNDPLSRYQTDFPDWASAIRWTLNPYAK